MAPSRIRALAAAALLLAQPRGRGAEPKVREAALRGHLAFLSHDLLEGRGTGQRGGDLAVAYLETQLAALGLRPAAPGGYRQAIPFVGARALADQSSLRFVGKGFSASFACGPEIIFNSTLGQPEVLLDAPLVWVGFGIHAPEEGWDDYKGLDVRGKLLVVLAGEPSPTPAEPGRFRGRDLTYYGRWSYKFEEAARRGAAGALLVHSEPGAAYGWNVVQNSGAGERFYLEGLRDGNPFQGWIPEEHARKLLADSGHSLDRLSARAQSRNSVPVDLGMRLQGRLVSQLRRLEQYNVAGLVPGTDPRLRDEVVLYSAHWDHLGLREEGIYNGAVDNASGCAALLAIAEAAARRPARRTQMFMFFCGEEQGLTGASGYVRAPLWPLAKTVADLNLDCLNFPGRTRDIRLPGPGPSSLGAGGGAVAARMGLRVRREPPDTQGLYFRADHFPLAKAGIPAFTLSMVMGADDSWDFVRPRQRELARTYVRDRYHTPKDRFDPAWDLGGMMDQARFLYLLGQRVANGEARPRLREAPPKPAPRRPR